MNSRKEQIWVKIIRILLACVFLYSGFTKAIDPVATSITFDQYFTSFGMSFLHPLSMLCAFCMTAAEFTLGFMMLFRIKIKFTSICYLLFMGFFFLLTLWLAIAEYLEIHHGYNFGVVRDCGCFGQAVHLSNMETFLKNVVIIIPTLIIFFKRKSIPDIRLTELGQWCFAAIGAILVFGFQAYCFRHLPVIDYSNWKVGENVADSFIEKPAVQDIIFIYRNTEDSSLVNLSEDGLMTITDSIPDFYEKYEYVDRKDSIISEYERAPQDGFNMLDKDGSDMAAEIFRSQEPVYIFFMHDLVGTNLKGIQNDEFKRIVRHCLDNDITIVGITNSNQESIAQFISDNKIEFPIYENTIDPIKGPFMVRDAVRSNPGLIIIQNGIVQAKYNWRDFKKVTF